jgi:hypothetical protein
MLVFYAKYVNEMNNVTNIDKYYNAYLTNKSIRMFQDFISIK